MDARLLDYYNRELAYLRELGAEFAEAFPNTAGHLGMDSTRVQDPYVERLLEGFSFLTARIHLKMDAEFPRFSQRLLDVVYPNYLAPLPSMAIVNVQPNLREGSLHEGYKLPAGTPLRAHLAQGEQTACDFRTAHALTLWPLRVAEVRLRGVPTELPLARLNVQGEVHAALHVRFEVCGADSVSQLPLDTLTFFLGGAENQALPLLELVLAHCVGVVCDDGAQTANRCSLLDSEALHHEGFDAAQALLPCGMRSFQGYRLLHEYFAFPARFLFFSIRHLRAALRKIEGTTFSLTILLDKAVPELERSVDTRSLALFCTPVINLFPKRTDRIAVSLQRHEHHLVVDRTRPLDHEIHTVEKVTGHLQSAGGHCEFRPFYGTFSGDAPGGHGRYFSVRREPRLGNAARGQGHSNAPAAYSGSEVFLSLVDQHDAPFSDDLRQLSVEALCTNRDLAPLIPLAGTSDFSLRISAPVSAVKVLRGPTPPRPALADSDITWRLISHLGLNYLTLTDLDNREGAQVLRELLELYAGAAQADAMQQIRGLRGVQVQPVYRQLPQPGPLIFGRGVAVSLMLDELAFAGASPYLFGAVLEQFFARHVSLNSFSELAVATLQRGEINRWAPRVGCRPIA
ncbi:type VI secretion system baseplate subunit TssF [Paraburkholderia sp. BL21I4N1]|uniref:type VI secretion system baseplate subunit TssF n=1 Tax=Paraburkholderia sp. BL21I4N1 TaxID=1938801 RepID=UPI000CFBA1B1|nr:type VI secretion system baseplate subunit TssF [Paraburkholderia sp. BL21I4N1]PQV48778.1 type VI secretion system protein ImpG [Paraburkholderia sp. BL21I4N1]